MLQDAGLGGVRNMAVESRRHVDCSTEVAEFIRRWRCATCLNLLVVALVFIHFSKRWRKGAAWRAPVRAKIKCYKLLQFGMSRKFDLESSRWRYLGSQIPVAIAAAIARTLPLIRSSAERFTTLPFSLAALIIVMGKIAEFSRLVCGVGTRLIAARLIISCGRSKRLYNHH